MSTTPTMFVVVRPDGYGKKQYVRVPFVSALLDPQEMPRRYFLLPPEDEAEPAPVKRPGRWGANPRRDGRKLEPLE